jgi:PAS domain S-box-containing protein
VRVLVVDDQEFIRRGIRAVLSDADDIEVCGEAVDGHEAISRTRQLKPDIVVMDISMPILDGIEATREIRQTCPKVRILTLSQYDLPDVAREAFEAGASTHVSKIYVWTQLVAALRRVYLGETFFDGNFAASSNELEKMRRGRLELERALRESEERFRRTFDVTSSGIGHAGKDGRWLRVNQRLCKMLGYTADELQSLQFQDITHPGDLPADLADTQKLIAGEIDRFAAERRLVRKDGGSVTVHLAVHAVRDSHGNLKYCIRVADAIADC